MDITSGAFWQGMGIFLAIILSPAIVATLIYAVCEMRERAWCRGYDEAWQRAVEASNNGMRLV
jgi:hypothetical protein